MLNKKVAVGFITYGQSTIKYLPDFVAGLKAQTFKDFSVLVLDNSDVADRANEAWLRQNMPEADIQIAPANFGFAKAANQLLAKAKSHGAEYFWLLNPDTCLDPNALAELVRFMDEHGQIAAASPKVLRWDFANKTKTKIIDTCGLILRPGFKFVDLGQGEIDNSQFDKFSILGPSGCSAFFKLAALGNLKFDENFFMYKEDCDLAYQMFLAGKLSSLVPSALVWHDRTVAGGARKNKGRQGKIWSFFGQHLLLKKYFRYQNFWSKLMIIGREILMLGYAVIFEPYLFKELSKVKRVKL